MHATLGTHEFQIPLMYFVGRSKRANYGKDGWRLAVLWPNMTPWRKNNPEDDKEFHALDGGRTIKITITPAGNYKPHFLLNRLIEEYDSPNDPGYSSRKLSFIDDPYPRSVRLTADIIYGLQPYYLDINKVLPFWNRIRNSGHPPLTAHDLRTENTGVDWFVKRDAKGVATTLVRCPTKEMTDDPAEFKRAGAVVLIPQCGHKIMLPAYGLLADIDYKRIYLPHWQEIENVVRALLMQFEIKKP